MDLKNICQHIYYATLSATAGIVSPIAYINVTLGKRCSFTEDELVEEFKHCKWDTAISTADLNITSDKDADFVIRIDEITDFYDENGKCDTFHVVEEDSVIL